ncbi:MAG: sodium:calcium antiporter [Patescibacteria group bacterium]
MFWDIVLFVIGFYVLIKGSNFLIDGATSLARNLGISTFVIGLVIVGIGTSIPEFAITFLGNLVGDADIGVGTLIGSNTFNILFVLGISALFFPLAFKAEWEDDVLWNLLALIFMFVFLFYFGSNEITRIEGMILLALFVGWLYISVKTPFTPDETEEPLRILTYPIAGTMIAAGFFGIILGANWVVNGAEIIARLLGMSETIIGLTLISIGTSLPELAVTFTAAFRKQSGIAVGTIVGSNVVNFLLIFGAAALAKPIFITPSVVPDMLIAAISATILYVFMYWGKRGVLERSQGAIMVILYVVYLFYIGARVFMLQ